MEITSGQEDSGEGLWEEDKINSETKFQNIVIQKKTE